MASGIWDLSCDLVKAQRCEGVLKSSHSDSFIQPFPRAELHKRHLRLEFKMERRPQFFLSSDNDNIHLSESHKMHIKTAVWTLWRVISRNLRALTSSLSQHRSEKARRRVGEKKRKNLHQSKGVLALGLKRHWWQQRSSLWGVAVCIWCCLTVISVTWWGFLEERGGSCRRSKRISLIPQQGCWK